MAIIMVVDDSLLMRAVLKNFISKEGSHNIIEADEGHSALQKYKEHKPKIVFMDILMPNGMDGISALKEIKKYDKDAIIVMVTSVKERKEFEEAMKAGVKGYITKPFSKEDIAKALKENL